MNQAFIDITDDEWDALLEAMAHFVWLDSVGALTREEASHIETFQRVLEANRVQ